LRYIKGIKPFVAITRSGEKKKILFLSSHSLGNKNLKHDLEKNSFYTIGADLHTCGGVVIPHL